MIPVNFEGAITVGKPANVLDTNCYSIYAMPVDFTQTGEDGETYVHRMWVERWQPSKEDREAVAAGRDIWIQIHSGEKLVPIAMFTLDENGQANQLD